MWIWVLLGYFALINVVTFVIWGIDKYKAIKAKWRISEKNLLYLSAFGGFVGAYAGMEIWRHKRIKGKFLWKWMIIVFVWLIILFGLLYFLS